MAKSTHPVRQDPASFAVSAASFFSPATCARRNALGYWLAVAGFDLSMYGRSHHSKNTHVRFHESICSGESTRSSVFGSTRRLNA